MTRTTRGPLAVSKTMTRHGSRWTSSSRESGMYAHRTDAFRKEKRTYDKEEQMKRRPSLLPVCTVIMAAYLLIGAGIQPSGAGDYITYYGLMNFICAFEKQASGSVELRDFLFFSYSVLEAARPNIVKPAVDNFQH